MPVGFTPAEATALAQAAYLALERQAPGSLHPIRPRPEISHVINHCVSALAGNQFGPKAHLVRIALWEVVFGEDTWPESIEYSDEESTYKQLVQNLLTEPLVPGWQPEAPAPKPGIAGAPPHGAAPKKMHQQPRPESASVVSATPAPSSEASRAIRSPLAIPPDDRSGRGWTITAGVTALLMASFNFLMFLGSLMDADDPTGGPGYIGVFLIVIATFALTGIGGATTCGINTLLARRMLLLFALVSAIGYIMVGISEMILIDSLVVPGLLNLGLLILAAKAAKGTANQVRT